MADAAAPFERPAARRDGRGAQRRPPPNLQFMQVIILQLLLLLLVLLLLLKLVANCDAANFSNMANLIELSMKRHRCNCGLIIGNVPDGSVVNQTNKKPKKKNSVLKWNG